ncbi:hypothetical protein ACS0TY_003634 [Phlomoides rotata]
MSYKKVEYPLARCSPHFGDCVSRNSNVEPPIVVHNMMLAHTIAVKVYRERFNFKASISYC